MENLSALKTFYQETSGLILVESDDTLICTHYNHQLIQDLITLSTTLRERLIQAKTIVYKNKRNLKNFFLKSDIDIFEKILKNTHVDLNTNFIEKIINYGLICYNDQPSKMIDAILASDLLKQYDRKSYIWLNKWMTLDDHKLTSILQDEVYLSFPHQFNDVFDAQYRFNGATKAYLVKECLKNLPIENQSPEQLLQSKLKYIDFIQAQLNSTNICCFSLLDPMQTLSNHMWGLYANCGKGVVLQYEIKRVIDFILTSQTFVDNLRLLTNQSDTPKKLMRDGLSYCRLLPVNYKDKTHENMLDWIQNFIKLHINSDQAEAEEIYKFLSNKHIEFEYEQEIRLISLEYAQDTSHKSHPLNPDYFFNNENALTLYKQNVAPGKNDYNYNRSLPFIQPSKIIYGWNFNENSLSSSELELYKKLITRDGIEHIYLEASIDYQQKPHQFTTIEKSVVL